MNSNIFLINSKKGKNKITEEQKPDEINNNKR